MAVKLPPRPVVPTPPPAVAAELETDRLLWDDVNAAFFAALNGGDHEGLDLAADRLQRGLLHRPVRTEQERTERDQWELAVRKYNEQAKAYNAALNALKQERRNAAQADAVRKAACSRCFATHAGEC